jgi:hypothetical protein
MTLFTAIKQPQRYPACWAGLVVGTVSVSEDNNRVSMGISAGGGHVNRRAQ